MLDEIELKMPGFPNLPPPRSRRLGFAGARNFRDLGGYETVDARTVRWQVLYRSGHLHKLTNIALKQLAGLRLAQIVDFRADHESEEEPDRLPQNADIPLLKIPILDSSTQTWRDFHDELLKDNLRTVDPEQLMVNTNVELATRFTPQMRQFIQGLFAIGGRPMLFHCAAGKDRTGFAAAILLRILGVPMKTVMEDYMLSNQYYLSSYTRRLFLLRLMKGERFMRTVRVFLEVRPSFLSAAFNAIDAAHGSFEMYVHNGLGLTRTDVEHLKHTYLVHAE
jgi:protein-tyrosine phosphatase